MTATKHHPEGGWICPTCEGPTKKLIENETDNLGCPSCQVRMVRFNPNLHQNVSTSKDVKLTTGKAWEIDNRVLSPDDGRTVVNRKTGKEAQY